MSKLLNAKNIYVQAPKIKNVYVPSVYGALYSARDDEDTWDYWGGLIANRNTDRAYQNAAKSAPTPGGWEVDGLYVLSHTKKPGKWSAITNFAHIFSISR